LCSCGDLAAVAKANHVDMRAISDDLFERRCNQHTFAFVCLRAVV
jgi:hypothetical protein